MQYNQAAFEQTIACQRTVSVQGLKPSSMHSAYNTAMHATQSHREEFAIARIITINIQAQHADLHELGEGLFHHLLVSQGICAQHQVESSLWVWLGIQYSNHGLHCILQDTSGTVGTAHMQRQRVWKQHKGKVYAVRHNNRSLHTQKQSRVVSAITSTHRSNNERPHGANNHMSRSMAEERLFLVHWIMYLMTVCPLQLDIVWYDILACERVKTVILTPDDNSLSAASPRIH